MRKRGLFDEFMENDNKIVQNYSNLIVFAHDTMQYVWDGTWTIIFYLICSPIKKLQTLY